MTFPRNILFGPAASAALFIALSAGGCGPTTSGIEGISCSTDADCNPGLKCLPYRVYGDAAPSADAGCPSIGNECLAPCKADADCAAQGPGLVCLTSCGGTAVCEAAADLGGGQGTDGGVDGAPDASNDSTVAADAAPETSSDSAAAADAPLEAEASGD